MTVVDAPSPSKPVPPAKPRTRAQELHRQLADEIVRGVLLPGTPLDETEVARRFGVSRTPVREAIRQLAASGLVETRAHRGAVVALPSPDRLVDMFRAMAELEALCAGLAAISMTAAERRALETMHNELGELMRQGDPLRYATLNEIFHQAIYTGTHNAYLAELTLQTRARVAPFRRAQFRTLGRLARSHGEHERVVQAILRGDRDAATNLMRAHIEIVREAYDRYAETV